MSARLTLQEATSTIPIAGRERVTLCYRDNSHSIIWRQLGEIVPTVSASPNLNSTVFTFAENISRLPADNDDYFAKSKAVIEDQLDLACIRSGIIRPIYDRRTADRIAELVRSESAVIVPDTNALANGSVRWLLGAAPMVRFTILPAALTIAQVQAHDAVTKAAANKVKPGNLSRALRSRNLVNSTLRLLTEQRSAYQIIEVDPQLLRYLKPPSDHGADPDQSDLLEDRLLIEAIQTTLRSMRSHSPKYVVTSDVGLSRVLDAEALEVVSLQKPHRDRSIPLTSARFEPLSGSFTGATLYGFLWELTHTFSEIKIQFGETALLTCSLYWAGKTLDDWVASRLELDVSTPSADADPSATAPLIQLESGPTVQPPSARTQKSKAANVGQRTYFYELAFTTIVEALSVLAERYELSLPDLIAEGNAVGISERQMRWVISTLDASHFLEISGESVRATEAIRRIAQLIESRDLDAASVILLDLAPYREAMASMREEGRLTDESLQGSIEETRGLRITRSAAGRIKRYPIYLGQAYSISGVVHDGSARPGFDYFISQFEAAYNEGAVDSICPVRRLFEALCPRLRMSPWAIGRYVELLRARGEMKSYTFETATARDASSGDEIISTLLPEPLYELVPLDRLNFGGHPVLTVRGRK